MNRQAAPQATVLVTGATGFVGKAVITRMRREPAFLVRPAVRTLQAAGDSNTVIVGDISGDTVWREAIEGAHIVVHLAARVHIMRDRVSDPLSEFRRVNVDGTLGLAKAAAAAGAHRFLYLSSIKVNGEQTRPGAAFTEADTPLPADPYGISKYEAELALRDLARDTGMEVVIIRPPLIYGPGVKANFASLLQWVYSRVPLPLGSIDNRRSFIGIDNIVDLIMTCLRSSAAANETFLAADGEDLSTTMLLERLGRVLRRRPILIPVPAAAVKAALTFLGKGEMAQRVCGSLQIDIGKASRLLSWKPPRTVDEGLRSVAEDFLSRRAGRAN